MVNPAHNHRHQVCAAGHRLPTEEVRSKNGEGREVRPGRQREGMASGDRCNEVPRCSGFQGWHPRTDTEAFQVTEDLEPEPVHQPLAGTMQGGLEARHGRDCLAVGVQGWVTTVAEPSSLSTSVYRITRWDQ